MLVGMGFVGCEEEEGSGWVGMYRGGVHIAVSGDTPEAWGQVWSWGGGCLGRVGYVWEPPQAVRPHFATVQSLLSWNLGTALTQCHSPTPCPALLWAHSAVALQQDCLSRQRRGCSSFWQLLPLTPALSYSPVHLFQSCPPKFSISVVGGKKLLLSRG